MKAIEIKNLNKFYGSFHAIKDINIEVTQGEIYGFIGPNGSGKSTAIRSILGLIQTSSGTAEILGKNALISGEKIRSNIGYLPSEINFYTGMNSLELLEYSAGFYPNVDRNRIQEFADYFQLNLLKEISSLSFGNKKKCAIIQAILHKPEVLILDEPTSGLDPLMQNKFFELLERENARGTTIFFSSHILAEVQRMCQRAAVIRRGKIVAIENIKDLLKKQIKKVHVIFENLATPVKIPEGAIKAVWNDTTLRFDFMGELKTLTSWLSTQNIRDITIEAPDLESVFMNYYKE